MSRATLEEEIRYHHPEKTLAKLPTRPEVTEAMIAPFFRTDVETYWEIRSTFTKRARRCARELLDDERFADLVDRLPFDSGTTIVGLGDSITDDLLSWFEILRHLISLRRSNDGLRLVNAGISGDTTSRLLGRILEVLEEKPGWLLILAGTNDVAFVREPLTKALVSKEETAKNLSAIRNLVREMSGSRLAWVTPPPVLEAQTTGVPAGEPVWRNADLAHVARLVHKIAGEDPVLDLKEVFGDPANPSHLLPDGLHPTLAGQTAIARALVERLAGISLHA